MSDPPVASPLRWPRLAFDTVQARLVAFFLIIAIPIGAITTATAVVTYRGAINAIAGRQAETAGNFAIRMRIWYVGVLRGLIVSAREGIGGTTETSCQTAGNASVRGLDGYQAMLIRGPGGQSCLVSNDPSLMQAELSSVLAAQAGKNLTRSKAVLAPVEGRYDSVVMAGKRRLVVYARERSDSTGPDGAGQDWQALLVVAPEALDRVFNLGEGDPDFVTALSTAQDEIVFARGRAAADRGWLPPEGAFPLPRRRWSAVSSTGERRIYYALPVGDRDLFIISSFRDKDLQAARSQFVFLLLAPLLALLLLLAVFVRVMNRHLVQWLKGIESASRARRVSGWGRVALSEAMPSDIRNVVVAFNDMVKEQESREDHLQAALAANHLLTRELHHRVKNNLQVVQSYIGLSKNSYSGDARMALCEAECRVHVLSAAYRGALAEGAMRPVAIDPFLRDVIAAVARLLCRPGQEIGIRGQTAIALPVDRAIPLGLLIVDRASAILHEGMALHLRIGIADREEGRFEFEFVADRAVPQPPQSRILAGLVMQLEATETTPRDSTHLGAWGLNAGTDAGEAKGEVEPQLALAPAAK
ncbi:sensor histidine kinase [Labrys okinawensis]|uniref:sensor histidine kinase n=1 Tax=Labrys okinawensis TaxID=346911 RepID=UPI0039BC9702